MKNINLKQLDTYVYIDASNIRNALRVLGITVDWRKLLHYFKTTYSKFNQALYFEGVDQSDLVKKKEFENIKNFGYLLRTLSRKSYQSPAKYKEFNCKKCHTKSKLLIQKSKTILKSNIDVYLCSEVMAQVTTSTKPIHLIILSCDGDYAEMIRKLISTNKKVYISVFATPYTKTNNYISVRLKELERIDRYYLVNILNIKDKISLIIPKKRESHRSGTLER